MSAADASKIHRPTASVPSGDLAERMRGHVRSRLPGSEPVIENGAWQMMLDAADELDLLRRVADEAGGLIEQMALQDSFPRTHYAQAARAIRAYNEWLFERTKSADAP